MILSCLNLNFKAKVTGLDEEKTLHCVIYLKLPWAMGWLCLLVKAEQGCSTCIIIANLLGNLIIDKNWMSIYTQKNRKRMLRFRLR